MKKRCLERRKGWPKFVCLFWNMLDNIMKGFDKMVDEQVLSFNSKADEKSLFMVQGAVYMFN